MAQGAIQRGLISAAMEVVNCGDVQGDPTKRDNEATACEDVVPVDIVCPPAGASPIGGAQSTHGWQRQGNPKNIQNQLLMMSW